MADPALLLGAAVVKTACKIWLKDQAIAADAAVSVVDIVQAQVSDAREQRRVRRLFEDLEERVADRVMENVEFGAIPANERDAAVLAVADTFDKVALTNEDLFAADLDAARLFTAVRPSGRRFTATLSEDATELYGRVLRDCCAYMVELANVLPGFQVGVFAELLSRQTELMRRMDERFDNLPAQLGGAGEERFEPAYQRLVAKQLDQVELFGVTVSESVSNYPLSVAYVSLSIHATGRHPAEKFDRVTSIEHALTRTKRAFIRGEAGSGKTTLLQWLAVRAARQEFDGPMADWNRCVPFFVRLRRYYTGQDLPAPEDFPREVARAIAHTMPLNWVHDLLTSGRALVLVDGVDELPTDQRRGARDWLRQLLNAFPNARYVVTSRPTAATETWLSDDSFDALEIQPMTPSDLTAFVDHWHNALTVGAPERDHARIEQARTTLTEMIRTRRHLRMLAVNPLMTALICALHLDRRGHLPDDRMELYAVALDMLLERRDTERAIKASGVRISRADKLLILEDLAYWLVRNGWSDVSRERVLERLTERLEHQHRIEGTPEEVLTHLLDRCGLLRMPVEGRIDFVHKTFQEYLAASAAVTADDIGLLVKNAHDDLWREVVLMAVGHARPSQRDDLLNGILKRPDCVSHHPRGYVLQALAVGSIQYAPTLSPDLRAKLETVAAHLLPPRNTSHADALVGAGDLVLELLDEREITTPEEAAATIRMASAIGGDHALSVIARCARTHDWRIHSELIKAWSEFDAEDYAIRVLAGGSHSKFVTVNDPDVLPGLKHLDVVGLVCHLAHGHGDVDYIDPLSKLVDFRLRDPALHDLSAIARHPRLKTLTLSPAADRVDITPLAECRTLRDLTLPLDAVESSDRITQVTSLNLTAGPVWQDEVMSLLARDLRLAKLTVRHSLRDRDLDCFAAAPQLTGLESLSLNGPYVTSIAEVGRWSDTMRMLVLHANQLREVSALAGLPSLEWVNLAGTPIGSVEFVRDLPALRQLGIGGAKVELPDLTPICGHPALRELAIRGNEDVDLSGLAGASGLKVIVENQDRRHVYGADKLPPTVEVSPYWKAVV